MAAVSAVQSLAYAATPQLVASVPHVEGMHDLGRASSGLRVRLAVLFEYRNAADLETLLATQRDPSSLLHNRFLSARQFRSYFAPTPATYARVAGLLRHAGFTVNHEYTNRTVLDVSAPPDVVNRYFHTEIRRFGIDGTGLRYANSKPVYLPSELRGAVHGIAGFDDIRWFQPFYQFVPRQQLAIPDVLRNDKHPLRGPDGAYGPWAYTLAYDLPARYRVPNDVNRATYDGRGRTAAIEIPADPTDADLGIFLNYYKIKRSGVTTRVYVDGGPSNPSGGVDLEAALDYQTIAGMAPGANVVIYEFPTFTAQDVLDGYNSAVSDDLADTVNSSFGACETSNIFNTDGIAHIFKQGAAQGQTFHAASGDSGTFTYGCRHEVSVATPADTPYTTAVGGTRLGLDGKGNYIGESYWNDAFGAGGGGVSAVFKQPAWQRKSHIPAAGRALPDISFEADPATGEDIVLDGHFIGGGIGGTSLSSPIFGACLVEMEQMNGGRVAVIDSQVYHGWRKRGYGANSKVFAHDVTTGKAFGILIPGSGFDLATGIGSLDCYGAASGYL